MGITVADPNTKNLKDHYILLGWIKSKNKSNAILDNFSTSRIRNIKLSGTLQPCILAQNLPNLLRRSANSADFFESVYDYGISDVDESTCAYTSVGFGSLRIKMTDIEIA
jgi:hypothetical protein